MIFTERTVTIRTGASSIDERVILYRGDRKVEIRFTIKDSKFKFQNTGNVISNTNAAYAQLAILNPNGSNTFTEITPTDNGTVLFEISDEMIDELEEVGLYSFHIRLFDEENESRITLPPVMDGIEIREPVIIEPPVGAVNEDNTITIFNTLKPGNYTLKYEFKNGTREELEEFTVYDYSNAYQINLMEEAEIKMNMRYSKSSGDYVDAPGVICFTVPFINDSSNAMILEFDNLAHSMVGNNCLLYVMDNDKSNPLVVNGNCDFAKMTSGIEVSGDRLSGTVIFTPPINEGYITTCVRTRDDDKPATEDEFKDYIVTLTMGVSN